MHEVEAYLDDDYRGFGQSVGLARGIQLRVKGENITQEGMGIGTCAMKDGNGLFFSQSHSSSADDPQVMQQTFTLDTAFSSGFKGIVSRLRDALIEIYQKAPFTQKGLLATGKYVRRIFGVEKAFLRVASRGEALFQYRLGENCVQVACEVKITQGDQPKICIMNEMGADVFANAWMDGQAVRPPTAWEKIDLGKGIPALYSSQYRMTLLMQDINVSGGLPYAVYWGREKTAELCWAGYTIEIDLSGVPGRSASCCYQICWNVQDEEDPA